MRTTSLLLLIFWAATSLALGQTKPSQTTASKPAWKPLLNGKDLKGWEKIDYGGSGEVKVEKGVVVLGVGNDLTGIRTEQRVPTINYEIALEAKRVDGNDFFCGLTFPFEDSSGTLICGNWGGGLCGLSSLNGFDASENSTSTLQEFEKGTWYKIRVRVEPKRIQAWIGDQRIVNADVEDADIDVRFEVEPSKPLGISTWQTTGAIRNLRIRKLNKN